MEEIVKLSIDAVVLVVVSDPSGEQRGQGSGFLISPDGTIVTNFHVIDGAHSAVVKLRNGAFCPVDGVLAIDKKADLALIKVACKGLPSLALGEAGSLAIGARVVAIGSPLDLQNTVSDGIVSSVRDGTDGQRWIQTTAPASPGNSGGPLLDSRGNVVGVITFQAVTGQNLNFAVPMYLRRIGHIQAGSSDDQRLQTAPQQALPSIVCEWEATKESWRQGGTMTPTRLRDLFHITVAMPYAEVILTFDKQMRRTIPVVRRRVAFPVATTVGSMAELLAEISP